VTKVLKKRESVKKSVKKKVNVLTVDTKGFIGRWC